MLSDSCSFCFISIAGDDDGTCYLRSACAFYGGGFADADVRRERRGRAAALLQASESKGGGVGAVAAAATKAQDASPTSCCSALNFSCAGRFLL